MNKKDLTGIRPAVWNVLTSRFSRMIIGLLGHSLRIITLPEYSNQIGATDSDGNIYLNPHNGLIKDLIEPEAVSFMTGVFAHESMHQQMTDFSLFEKARDKKPKHEQNIFRMIWNIIEDPAIEYFASRFFGGKLLESLHFAVMQTYKQSSPINKAKNASSQFFAAMIQYGNGGILKGEFTFPEARKTFREVIPFFDKAIESFASKPRLDYTEKVFEISRPIWVNETEALKELMDEMERLGKDHSASSGKGNPNFKPGDGSPKETKTEKRRKITFRKISKEEAEELKKNGVTDNEIPPDGDIEVLLVESGDDSKKDDKNNVNSIGNGAGTEKDNSKPDGKPLQGASGNGEKSENNNKDEAKMSSVDITDENHIDNAEDTGESFEITDDEYILTDERLDEIVAEVKSMLEEAEVIKNEQAEADGEIIDVPELAQKYKGLNSVNHKIKSSNPAGSPVAYNKIIQSLSGNIALLVSQFERIFKMDTEEREHHTSGRLSIKRLSTGTQSSRVFDRRRLPGNKRDTAIILLVDESGSMNGIKISVAMLTAILLAEVFAKIGITVKVIGFTFFGKPHHYHYISWKNLASERPKMLEMSAKSNNLDGYSIRYSGELLKKRPESHKMLIVISDGIPSAYDSKDKGIADTRNAVKEVSKFAKVFGVLIGNDDATTHHIMYGDNLMHISNINELPQRLAKKISTAIKEW
ncbi:MAG: hypothetical protein LBI03_08755 [Clostridiales bacterium]|jgi:acylphosphatase|nr:hypothetical protein [Clostridiales bacterium]